MRSVFSSGGGWARRRLPALAAGLAALGALAAGPVQREANTTLRMPPELPAATSTSYATTNFATGFINPIALAVAPGETNRMFVCERAGVIAVITNLANPTRQVFMNIGSRIGGLADEGGLLALAFHPGFATNRRFFVYYTAPGPVSPQLYDRVSRFTAQTNNPNAGDTNSEAVLISQLDEAGTHNGGDLQFGPDGFLYFSAGDEGNGCDVYHNSQSITGDFFSAVMRLDVDPRPGSLAPNPHAAIAGATTNYAVPPDNPFVGATQFNGAAVSPDRVRTEFWAVGLRNPWRMSFDGPTGQLYLHDVGQTNREEVNVILRGGNYGWKWREGKPPTGGPCALGAPPAGFTNWIDPVLEYAHGFATNQGNAIGGGHVYRGNLLPELYGRYLLADYISGHLWAMTHDGTNATSWSWLATDNGITCMLPDPRNGELLMTDLGGQIKRLVHANAATGALPATLAGTGIFTNLATLATAPGFVPFDVNTALWSDHAAKRRWLCVPSTNLAIGFHERLPWTFPTGTVWVKHFELELTNGDASSARRLETRVLVKNATASEGYGVTYRWGTSLTNATLVPDGGLDEPFAITDGGTIRTQVWHYPSRGECLACHNSGAGFALGVATPQLNRDFDYGGEVTNQLRVLARCGYFAAPPASFVPLPALAAVTNAAWSAEWRVRSYLAANCAQCHFPGGPAPANFDARIVNPVSQANLIDGSAANPFGDPANRVVAPGDPAHSILLSRMSVRGAAQMPPLASALVDTQAVALVTAWIQSLAGWRSFAQWQLEHFGSTNAAGTGEGGDFDGDGAVNRLEYLLGTQPTNALDAWGLASLSAGTNDTLQLGYLRIANRGFDLQTATNLPDPAAWQSSADPANAPFFAATGAPVTIGISASNLPRRFLRLRVYEP